MNERIKELAEQANEYALNKANEEVDEEDFDYSFDDDFKSKFAELIVRECISALDDADGSIHHSECLLEHFGVEAPYEPEYCPTCGEEWSGTSCGVNCGWVTGGEV
jgi:hypothetical protein